MAGIGITIRLSGLCIAGVVASTVEVWSICGWASDGIMSRNLFLLLQKPVAAAGVGLFPSHPELLPQHLVEAVVIAAAAPSALEVAQRPHAQPALQLVFMTVLQLVHRVQGQLLLRGLVWQQHNSLA